jgi:transposase
MSYKLEIRKSIYKLVGRIPKAEICRIFQNENISRRTIYRTIAECEQGIPCLNLPKSGRPRAFTAQRSERLVRRAKNQIGMSTRRLARQYRSSKSTISLELRRNGLKYRKRRKCPKYSQAQLLRIPRCCRQLRRVHFANEKIIILDDEKYFTLSNSEMKGNDGFYMDNVEECPDNVRYKHKAKFADKILVWCAISNRGVSRPFVGRVRGEALNSQSYIDSCLSKLLQFVREHHANDDIMFWPDLASCHYSRDTQNWLRQHHIPFLPKNDNPPNLPQARPTEDFWAVLSRKVYHGGWEAQDEEQLRRRIYEKLREIELNSVQDLMRDIRRNLRLVEQNGPLHIIR